MKERIELSRQLFESGIIQFGDFTLKSGLKSPVYLDLRLLIGHPKLLAKTAVLLSEKLKACSFDRIAGIPYAALAIATAVSIHADIPMVFPRKEAKSYGTQKRVEGPFKAGETVAVIDDLITTGQSKIEACQPLIAEGLLVKDFVVLIDRDQGGKQELEKNGYCLHAVLTIHELLGDLHGEKLISDERFSQVKSYLDNTNSSQAAGVPK